MRFIEGIEGMEEFLLGSFFACNELYVVNDEHVNVPEMGLEFTHSVSTKGGDEFIHKGF